MRLTGNQSGVVLCEERPAMVWSFHCSHCTRHAHFVPNHRPSELHAKPARCFTRLSPYYAGEYLLALASEVSEPRKEPT
jgi:hypothetical protein